VLEALGGALRPLNQRKAGARVVGMAARAAGRFDGCLSVQAATPFCEPGDVAMAGGAAGLHGVPAAAVAAGALEGSLQLAMGAGQRSRGNLGRRPPDGTGQQEREDGEESPHHQNQVIPTAMTTAT
jgi:hypothetical protein